MLTFDVYKRLKEQKLAFLTLCLLSICLSTWYLFLFYNLSPTLDYFSIDDNRALIKIVAYLISFFIPFYFSVWTSRSFKNKYFQKFVYKRICIGLGYYNIPKNSIRIIRHLINISKEKKIRYDDVLWVDPLTFSIGRPEGVYKPRVAKYQVLFEYDKDKIKNIVVTFVLLQKNYHDELESNFVTLFYRKYSVSDLWKNGDSYLIM